MRKAIIMLLAVLMLIAFVSCDDQKVTEEMREQATEAFKDTYLEMLKITKKYGWRVTGEFDLSKWNSEDESDADAKEEANSLIRSFLASDGVDSEAVTDLTVEKASGVFAMKMLDNGKEWKVTNIEISYSYKDNASAEKVEKQITMNGLVAENDTDDSMTLEVSSLNSNGVEYKPITFTKVPDKTSKWGFKISEAICGGVKLDPDTIAKFITSLN